MKNSPLTVRKRKPFSEKIYSAEKSDDSLVAICYKEKFLESVVYTNKIRSKLDKCIKLPTYLYSAYTQQDF